MIRMGMPTSEPDFEIPPLDFCEICSSLFEKEEIFKNEKCDHSFCLQCMTYHLLAKIKEGFKIVTCPGLNCYSVLDLDSLKQICCKYMLSLWKEAHPTEVLVPNSTSSKEFHAKTSSENNNGILRVIARRKTAEVDSKRVVPVKKAATANRIPAHSSFKNVPTLIFDSSWEQSTDSVLQEKAAAAVVDKDFDAWPDTDDYDSEGSPRSPEACKKSKWFKKFVEGLANLSSVEIKDPARRWHCPACQGGVGATKRYLGLQALIQHAKTKGSKRVRLHRELGQLLEENLLSKDNETSAIPTEEAICPKWKGLRNDYKDYEIVWPPMVIIVNTFHEKYDNDKRIGIPKQELLDMFSSYDGIVKVQQPYNWKGHSGFSFLIFESSAKGYLEAVRLHSHFTMEGTGKDSLINPPPTDERQLHGFLAIKKDLEIFDKLYFKGKSKLKYEVRSYQEMVGNRIRQMTEDNHQLLWLKNRVAEQESQAQELEKSNTMLKEKMRTLTRDLDILRRKASQQHDQSVEEMESLEQFYKEKIRTILEPQTEHEEDEEQENANLSDGNYYNYRNEETANPVKNQRKGKETVAEAEAEAESFEVIIQEMVNPAPSLLATARKRRHRIKKPSLPAVKIAMPEYGSFWEEF